MFLVSFNLDLYELCNLIIKNITYRIDELILKIVYSLIHVRTCVFLAWQHEIVSVEKKDYNRLLYLHYIL